MEETIKKEEIQNSQNQVSIAMPLIVYISYLVGCFIGISAVIGVILAYVLKNESNPEWLNTHYRYQIRTFWIGFLYIVILTILSILLTASIIGYPAIFLLGFLMAIWIIVRCAKGIKQLNKRQPVQNLMTWWF